MDYPEGATPLTPDELEGLKFPHISTRAELDHLEQANIQIGMSWMRNSRRVDLLTESYLRELHRRLFGQVWDWAGSFRQTEKNIGIDPISIPVELRKLLDDLSYWLDHESYPVKEAALRFHHRLVYIHPFPNGNGRHARIMADAILIKLTDSPGIDWSGGKNFNEMSEWRKLYISALRNADQGDYSLLLKLFHQTA